MFSTIRQSMQLFGSFQDTQMLALGDEGEEFDLQVGQDAARGVAGACRAARERSGDAARWRSVCVKKWRLARPGRASPRAARAVPRAAGDLRAGGSSEGGTVPARASMVQGTAGWRPLALHA